MLWVVAVLLLLLWLVGVLVVDVEGALIHLLLVLAVVVFIANLVRSRRVV
jgi:Family of unknown function (DUF5670)